MRYRIAGMILALCVLQAQGAENDSWLTQGWNTITETYDKGSPELYLPFRTYHVRSAYSREKIDSYQEHPPGLGYGHGLVDDKGNWWDVYAMGFQDSHFKPEWVLGYSWKAMWGRQDGWQTGLGYTAGLTMRADIDHYTPIPILLPVASIGYGKVSLEATYVPGAAGTGNVFFFWGKLAF